MKNNHRLILSTASLLCATMAASSLRAKDKPAAATYSFSYKLQKPALTSAGVYDAQGKLVKVLWTMKKMAAGKARGDWDGKDGAGKEAPKGKYTYKVAVSNATYNNIGIIGNSGTNTFTHVPNNFESVAVDAQGNVFTVHDWDEPHHDVKMWDDKTGRVVAHSGHPIGGLLKAVAVDEQYAYTTSYENLDNRKEAKFTIHRLELNKTPGAANWPIEPFTKAGAGIMVYNGQADYPAGASDAEKGAMRMPLLSLAVAGDTLYATDALAGKVRLFDKVTGEEKDAITVPLPQAVAVSDDGKWIYVGHEHSKISVFRARDGGLMGTPVNDLKEVNALALYGNRLYVADQGAGQVKIYNLTGDIEGYPAKLVRTFGEPARPGDRAAHRFHTLHGLAVDKDGNIITAQNEHFFNGGRLAKFSPEGKPLWENQGLEFVSIGTYSSTNPDWFVSAQHHGYALDRKTATAKSTGNTYNREGYKASIGPMRAAKLGQNEFVFMANGDGMIVYRVQPAADKFRGPTLKMAAILAASAPRPDGVVSDMGWHPTQHFRWSWHDERGDGAIQDGEQIIFSKPEDGRGIWQRGPVSADDKGNLWFASYDWSGADQIWVIPLLKLNRLGNPIYEWKNARRVTKSEQIQTTKWKPQPKMVGASGDSFYLYAASREEGTPQNGGLHMGGNVLMRFDLKKGVKIDGPAPELINDATKIPDTPSMAEQQWEVLLPEVAVGLDIIPGGAGGVMIGGYPFRGGIHHYTKDGLLIGAFNSDEKRFGGVKDDGQHPSGLMDFYGALNVNRDPRDGILDVFAEDDFNNRIFWYRVDDRDVKTILGAVEMT